MIRKLVVLFAVSAMLMACRETVEEPNLEHQTQAYPFTLPEGFPEAPFPNDNLPTVEGVYLGRMLFYDPVLSRDSTQSCASCHNQSQAFTDNGRALSVGIRGLTGTRNSMPLFNLAWNRRFFWDGRSFSLRHQSLMPIQDPLEMDESIEKAIEKLKRSSEYTARFKAAFGTEDITEDRMAKALEQFMNIIVSGNSRFDKHLRGEVTLSESEKRGMTLFLGEFDPEKPDNSGADCFHCHSNTLFSNFQFMNNGLDSVFTDKGLYDVTGNPNDMGKFKVPSLRNVEVSGPYMHDGRFETLEEVIDFYNAGVKESASLDPNMHAIKHGLKLSDEDKQDLIAFMKTLTDPVYLNNPEYKNPFKP